MLIVYTDSFVGATIDATAELSDEIVSGYGVRSAPEICAANTVVSAERKLNPETEMVTVRDVALESMRVLSMVTFVTDGFMFALTVLLTGTLVFAAASMALTVMVYALPSLLQSNA